MRRYKDIAIFAGILTSVIGLTTIAEQLTMTSYYPSPYGSYRQLRSSQGANFATTSGNVGIGTTVPGAELEVYSTGEPNIYLKRNSSSYAAAFDFRTAGSRTWQFLVPSGGNDLSLRRSDGNYAATFTQTGNVGIGTTSPGARLDVAGDARASWVQSAWYSFGDNQTSGTQWKLYSPAAGVAAIRYVGDNQDSVRFGKRSVGGSTSWGVQIPQGTGGGGAGIMFDTLDAGGLADANEKPYISALSSKMIFNVPSGGNYQWKVGGAIRMTLSSAGNLNVPGTITAQGGANPTDTLGANAVANNFDLAESIHTTPDIEIADLVRINPKRSQQTTKTMLSYDPFLLGAITSTPGIQIGKTEKGAHHYIALAGRVSIKVNLQNGPIKRGDYITSSSKPGIGMKATKAGRVLGIALGEFPGKDNPANDKGQGKVVVFINPHWWEGDTTQQLARLKDENETLKLRLDKLELKAKGGTFLTN